MSTQNRISERLQSLNFSLQLEYYYQDGQTFDEFNDAIRDAINSEEIIYYSKAIEYLKENDPSLNRSLSIAKEFGLEIDNLNSELLATLLYQEELSEEYSEIQNEVEQIFEEENEEEE